MTTSPRLHLPGPIPSGSDLTLPPDRSHYVSRVLRLRAGDSLVLFDGGGREFPATVAKVSREEVRAIIGEPRARDVESPLQVHLIQGIPRGDRMDIIVQKATELGVHRITPVVTGFSVVRLDAGKAEKRARHWTKIAQSACEQCGRNVVPIVDSPQGYSEGLAGAEPPDSARIVLQPAGRAGLTDSLEQSLRAAVLLVGPEGGLSDAEAEDAAAAGFVACSLGPRILRTDTAAIATIALLQAYRGDLDDLGQ
jgi:16S rRNA (uracil1498-N3)-methyltransferase